MSKLSERGERLLLQALKQSNIEEPNEMKRFPGFLRVCRALSGTPSSCWRGSPRRARYGPHGSFYREARYATQGRFQLTTDGFIPYKNAVSYSLDTRVDYAMLIKIYANDREGEQKYSPPQVVDTTIKPMIGNPDPSRI